MLKWRRFRVRRIKYASVTFREQRTEGQRQIDKVRAKGWRQSFPFLPRRGYFSRTAVPSCQAIPLQIANCGLQIPTFAALPPPPRFGETSPGDECGLQRPREVGE